MSDRKDCFDEKMQALTRLAGGVAHQFNNLLAAILATADLTLESVNLDPSLRTDLQQIREAARRASGITRQLIAFSGSQTLSLRATKVNEVIRTLQPMLTHVMPLGVAVSLDLRAALPAPIDPMRLEQTLLTLVVNAADSSRQGGTIWITTRDDRDAAGPFTEIIIKDNGHGMDEQARARLFEPFFTTEEDGRTEKSLGLAAVFGMMQQHGGSVHVESAPGEGTTVRLRFPHGQVAPVATARVSTSGSASSEVVLVVDDEAMVRAPMCRALRKMGYFVLEADNGEHALTVMQEHHSPVHLVITDVQMPEMDGAELVSLLRDWYPRMRVLFMSGYSQQYLESRAGTVDGSAFLAKPFSMDALRGRVRELLDTEFA